jgi:uncharacterized protein
MKGYTNSPLGGELPEFEPPDKSSLLGHVIAVTGSQVRGFISSLDSESGFHHVQVGNLVRIAVGDTALFGVVRGMHIENPTIPPSNKDQHFLDLELLGQADSYSPSRLLFNRGVTSYPRLGDPIYTSNGSDLAQIYFKPDKPNVRVGSLHQKEDLPAYAITDELLGKHFAILGSTGSGKSCALAVILRSILLSHPYGHIIILDPHEEYSHAFEGMAEMVTVEDLELPYWMLNFEELRELLCSVDPVQREIESAILLEAVVTAKREFHTTNGNKKNIKVDTPVPYWISKVEALIKEGMGQLNRPAESLPYIRLLSRIEALQSDKRFAFMFSGAIVRDNMAQVLARILRMPVQNKPVTVISLSGMPSEIVNVVVSVLFRLIFEFAVWRDKSQDLPMLLVCEEAHRYVPRDSSLGFGPVQRTLGRIAKEGRKYGLGLGLVTQRPSELSEVILSQCSTLFAMRLSNEEDQKILAKALPESSFGILTALSALSTQEAIVVGEGVSLPMRIRFSDLVNGMRPKGRSAAFSTGWENDHFSDDHIQKTLERWRSQKL